VGLLVTSLNLIPAGQLDGGHIFHLLFGTRVSSRLLPLILLVLVGLGFFWSGWWLWAGLVFFFGRRYAEPLDQITPLDGKRKALGIIALIIFILTFTPVPLTIIL
jgi:membrane-associated protease RseP (regulator of RpoE activity)